MKQKSVQQNPKKKAQNNNGTKKGTEKKEPKKRDSKKNQPKKLLFQNDDCFKLEERPDFSPSARFFTHPQKEKKKFHAPGTVIFTNTCRFCVQGLVCLVSVMPYSSSESASRSEAPSSSSSSPPQSRTRSWYVLVFFLTVRTY